MKKAFIFLLLLIGLAGGLIAQASQIVSQTKDVKYLLANPNKLENLNLVWKEMLAVPMSDLNQDGKINCIDYSLKFRYLYGSDARLIANENPNNGFNHMFIGIIDRYNNRTIYLEPQGHMRDYDLKDQWGDRYDPKYNKDKTFIYSGTY